MQSDSYNGKVWCWGTNYYQYNYGSGPPYFPEFIAAYSGDDGVSWTEVTLGTDIDNYSGTPYDEHGISSANQDGYHIAQEVFFGTGPYTWGVYYWRPTSNTTWDTPVLLFDYDTSNYEQAPGLLASRITSGLVLAANAGYAGSYDCIYIRRSTDSGQSFAAEYGHNLNTPGAYWDAPEAQNLFQMVELADGRIVIVAVHDGPTLRYCVSENLGVSFGSWVFLGFGSSFWIKDPKFYTEKVFACARGVDIVVTQTDRTKYGRNFIFRP
jgi:hypothetical protein